MANKILPFFFFITTFCFSQDTLILLNGKTKLAVVEKIGFDFVHYKKIKKDGTIGHRKKKNLDHIFSVNKTDTCIYVYQKDSMLDNFWSVSEMKSYLKGRRQARKHFKPYKTMLIGAGIGTGVAMYSLFPIKYGEKESILYVKDTITNSYVTVRFKDYQSLTIPMPYWEIIPLGIYAYYSGKASDSKKLKADDMEMFSEEMFTLGYQETVIDRKIYSAVGASFASFLTTLAGYMIFDPVEN
tara:strand:+ start:43597 stop:44319 length:723 start_codon:yes stop_codon:yes gene_type:complete